MYNLKLYYLVPLNQKLIYVCLHVYSYNHFEKPTVSKKGTYKKLTATVFM